MQPLAVTAHAPAKLILSGEHAVLYGQPALAVAVQRHTTCTLAWDDVAAVSFSCNDFNFNCSLGFAALQQLRAKLYANYQQFLQGQQQIKSVLANPFDLLQYAVASFVAQLKKPLSSGIKLAIRSDIPVGCGMGSSAALVISTLYGLGKLLQLGWDTDQYVALGKSIEDLQHGRSSGLDLQLVTRGGCLFYNGKTLEQRVLPKLPLYVVHTGKPQSTTGECVAQVAKIMQPQLAQEFGKVTNAVDQALAQADLERLQTAIKRNHQLLLQLQIVPSPVADFIQALEAAGFAAKICGAGAISGDGAGMVLICGESNTTMQQILTKYNYTAEVVEAEAHGIRII